MVAVQPALGALDLGIAVFACALENNVRGEFDTDQFSTTLPDGGIPCSAISDFTVAGIRKRRERWPFD